MKALPGIGIVVAALVLFAGGCVPPSPIQVDQRPDGSVVVSSDFSMEEKAAAAEEVARAMDYAVEVERTQRARNRSFYLTPRRSRDSALSVVVQRAAGGSTAEVQAVREGASADALAFANRLASHLRALDEAGRRSEVRVQSGRTTSF